MSISFAGWLGDTDPLVGTPSDHEQSRAAAAHRRVMDKPSTITFLKPNGTTLAAQTLRVEVDNTATLAESAAGAAPTRKAVVYGWKGHATLADSDIGEGYRFVLDADEYYCVDVIETIGERQGVFESAG